MSIEISNLNGTNEADGDFRCVGLITNKGKKALRGITVEVTMFDDGTLVGVEEDYIGDIPAGSRRGFEVQRWDCYCSNFEVNCYL
tara:strand:- start:371 stop:625 length:255 start_codon:yes stop_codon:yes gene_type:complete